MDASSVVRWEHQPQLRHPIMVAAFEGWSDAGDAASLAGRYLAETWAARRFATIDPEEFFDFTASRPHVKFADDGVTRLVEWPDTLLQAAPIPGTGRDVVILRGTEPQLHWRGYCDTVLGIATTLGVELVVTLGALLADIPHTRPVTVLGAAYELALANRLGLEVSRYEGETGIVGVLHDAFVATGLPSVGLWASVPHYVHQVSSPKAALALVERATSLLGGRIDTGELQAASDLYVRTVNERVADDEEAIAYVAQLEEAADQAAADATTTERLPSGDMLAAEAERFLRDHGRD